MPTPKLPPDPVLLKLVRSGLSNSEIARLYGVTPQAVSKKVLALGIRRLPVSDEVNAGLRQRWGDIYSNPSSDSHHLTHPAKALKIWLRYRLGDSKLSQDQVSLAKAWIRGLSERDEVLCYDRDHPGGWYYRPRTPADNRLIVDWPESIPFPDERWRKALELPALTDLDPC
jgi:hypothetical protein